MTQKNDSHDANYSSPRGSAGPSATRRRWLLGGTTLLTAGLAGCPEVSTNDRERTETSTYTEPTTDNRETAVDGSWPAYQWDATNSGHPSDSRGLATEPEQLWTFNTGSRLSTVPIVVDSTVIVGAYDKRIRGINAESGTETWSKKLHRTFSTPTVADDVVLIGREDQALTALNHTDGTEAWTIETPGKVISSPVVADGTAYFGCMVSGDVQARAVENGSHQWTFETAGSVSSSPALDDGTLYIGSNDRNLYAIDLTDGVEQWRFETNSPIASSPAVDGDTVYIGTGSADNKVFALDAADGSVKWSFETDEYVTTSPAYANGSVYVGARDLTLYALDAATGDEQWAFKVGYLFSSPIVSDGTVYVGTMGRRILAVDAETGTKNWQKEAGNSVPRHPVVVSGVLFASSWDYNLYAFG